MSAPFISEEDAKRMYLEKPFKLHDTLHCTYQRAIVGVIAAAALKCMGGSIQGRLWPRNEDERKRAIEAGYDLSKVDFPV